MRQPRPLWPIAWSVKQVADALGIERKKVYDAIKAGHLPQYRLGVSRRSPAWRSRHDEQQHHRGCLR